MGRKIIYLLLLLFIVQLTGFVFYYYFLSSKSKHRGSGAKITVVNNIPGISISLDKDQARRFLEQTGVIAADNTVVNYQTKKQYLPYELAFIFQTAPFPSDFMPVQSFTVHNQKSLAYLVSTSGSDFRVGFYFDPSYFQPLSASAKVSDIKSLFLKSGLYLGAARRDNNDLAAVDRHSVFNDLALYYKQYDFIFVQTD